jgi:hypothetical protein
MGSRTVLDVLENRKISCPYRDLNPGTKVNDIMYVRKLKDYMEILRTTGFVTTVFPRYDQWTIDN